MVKVSLIAAVAENGVIGKNNDLPWKIKSEFQYFRHTTMGKPVIVGRKTFDPLKGPLQGRTNIVITSDRNYRPEGALVVHSFESALRAAREIAAASHMGEIFVIGGEEVYRQALPYADKLYLTEIHLKPEGDAHFPAFDRSEWHETRRAFHRAKPGEDGDYTITVLERNQK